MMESLHNPNYKMFCEAECSLPQTFNSRLNELEFFSYFFPVGWLGRGVAETRNVLIFLARFLNRQNIIRNMNDLAKSWLFFERGAKNIHKLLLNSINLP